MKKKIIAAVALLAIAWAGIFGLAACGKKPEPVKATVTEYKVTPTVKLPEAKPVVRHVKKHRPVRKAEAPKCTSSFLGIPTC